MSSESSFIASLPLVQTNVYKIGGPILMSLGTISCVLSLAVFSQKNLRKNPCSTYFLAYNTVSLLAIYAVILPSTLSIGYNIDATLYNPTLCRLHMYTLLLSDVLGPSYIILASVDRVLVTSRNALTRRRSTRRLAYLCIICVTSFWLLAESHTLVLTGIQSPMMGFSFCSFQLGNYFEFISYYTAIVKGILIPLLMLILGVWTIKNVRSMGRTAPIASKSRTNIHTAQHTGLQATHRKDRQLIRILLVDIAVYLFFSLFLSVSLVYTQIIPSLSESVTGIQITSFLYSVGDFLGFIPSCIAFYNNLFVSKTFRHEAKNVLMCK